MNFDDEDGPQRPIGGRDSLDRKIAGSPSPYALAKKKKTRRAAAQGEGVTITDHDVLCGRGKTSFNHPGNKRFRDLITSSIPEYNRSESRLEKSLVVHGIVESIRGPGGRFLKLDQVTGNWQELDDRACREKVGHAVRDAATTTQTRREKKRQLQSQHGGMPNILPAAQGPTARYTEMKLDTPDQVSFRDMVHFSNYMSGHPPAQPFLALEPRPLPDLMQRPSLVATAAAARAPQPPTAEQQPPVAATATRGTATDQEHPPDEVGFMAQIDQVLGPHPPDDDPIGELLDMS